MRPPTCAGRVVAAPEVARQNLDRLVPAGLGDLVNGAAVGIGRTGVEAGRESAANRFDIARAGRVENAFAVRVAPDRCGRHAPLSCRQLAKPYSRASAQLDGGELGLAGSAGAAT